MAQIPMSSSNEPPSPMPSPSPSRLWRPAAQRNMRNQWANLSSYKHKWVTLSSTARSHSTSLVNSVLSQRYLNARNLGVLSHMPDIKNKASIKLFKQQEFHRSKLLSSYKEMVDVVIQMVTVGASMRCFLSGATNSSLLHYSNSSVDNIDSGDGGGISVFTFWSISSFEKLALELIRMFTLELNMKRLLVIEFLYINSEDIGPNIELVWLEELYSGEFDDLGKCNLCSSKALGPVLPRLESKNTEKLKLKTERQPHHDVLQVYLTTWLADVNIDKYRMNEIFALVSEEMNVNLV